MAYKNEEESEVELIYEDEDDSEAEGLETYLDPEAEELEQPFSYDEDSPNLVLAFEEHEDGKAALKEIAAKVVEDFEEARQGTEEYRERMARDWKLFAGELDPKDWPFKDCANAHVPIMLENLSRLYMRFFSEIFGDGNFFSVMGAGAEDDEVTHILTNHSLWQFNEQIDDFYRQQERSIMAYVNWGDTTIHSFYDFNRQENRHETLTPDQFYIPYVYTTTRVDYSDVPYVVKVLLMYRHDLQSMREQWEHVDEVLEKECPSWSDDPDSPMAESAAEAAMIEIPTDSKAPYKLLQYEGWLELPDQPKDRYCQVIIDPATKNILKLSIHEETDWRDRARYELQMGEYSTYMEQLGAYNAAFDAAKEQENQTREGLSMSMDVPGEMKDPIIGQVAAQAASMVQPQRPEWMTDDTMPPADMKKKPIHMFSHGVCIESMFGSLGLSYGRIQADYNRGANTMLSQFIDAATLNNCSTFLSTDAFDPKGKGDGIEYRPGKINYITGTSGDDIRKSIMELKPGSASPQLAETVDRLYQYGQSSIQAPEVLSGAPGKSGETKGGIMARIDQATKQLSFSAKKYARVLNNVVRNNARLNATFLPDNELVQMADSVTGMQIAKNVGRRMYERNYRIRFASDMKFSSQAQRISEADELLQLPGVVPPLQSNASYMYQTIKGSLLARNRADLIQTLGPPPPSPTAPFGSPPPPPPGPPGMPPEGEPPQ